MLTYSGGTPRESLPYRQDRNLCDLLCALGSGNGHSVMSEQKLAEKVQGVLPWCRISLVSC